MEADPRLRALVPIADGTEEIEAVCIIDVLRRAGVEVVVAGVGAAGAPTATLTFIASRGVRLSADLALEEAVGVVYDAIVLPGGLPGAEHLRDSALLATMLADQDRSGRLVAAICAAPVVVLQAQGLVRGRGATCFPGLRDRLEPGSFRDSDIVRDGNLLTSRGPGTAIAFALAIVEHLCGRAKRDTVAAQLLVD
jgi:4-methyl-5(b-hydroxyethyl)-thiazole monophosphate biosynthesis